MKLNTMITVLTVWILFFAMFVGLIQISDKSESAALIVPVDYFTIQEAIDAAKPGDTIYVWDGVYKENIIVNKTVNLIGNSSATTIIDGNQAGNVVYIVSGWVNMTGLSIRNGSSNGIYVEFASYAMIEDCNISSNNGFGFNFYSSNRGTIRNSNITFNGGGVYLQEWTTDDTLIENCNIFNNSWVGIQMDMNALNTQIIGSNISGHTGYGIFMWNSNNALIKNTNIWKNEAGIYTDYGYYITMDDVHVYDNIQYGLHLRGYNIVIKNSNISSNTNEGLRMEWSSDYDIINTTIENHATGILSQGVKNVKITNSSISNCSIDFYLSNDSNFDLLNTTFNKSRVSYGDLASTITVRWFLHVYVNNSLGNPIPGASVIIRNATGIGVFEGITDSAGYVNWIIVTEYYGNQSIRWYHTAHNITSYDGTLFGWAIPEANMTESKVVVVTLSSPMPAIDYIRIEDAIGGNAIGNTVYRIEDLIPMYAIAYNNTIGFIGPVPATWSSNDTGVGGVDLGPSTKTTFRAYSEGICFVSAVNGSQIDTTGVLTVIWLVENLDQATLHPTIQKAINAANPGDRLLAKPWTYYETVRVNKTVSLMGTDKSTTIVHGGGMYDAFQVEANWVNISGFSAIGGGTGIGVYNTLNAKIEDCLLYSNNYYGIYVGGAENTVINDTEVYSNAAGGILLVDWFTRYTTITNSYIHDNLNYGIHSDMGAGNTEISFCNITGNSNDGIYMWSANQIAINNCNIWNNNNGISLEASNNIDIANSNIYSNSMRGISVTFGGSNYNIMNSNIESNNQEGIFLSGAANFKIWNTSIVNHTFGIWASGSSTCDIINSSIINPGPATDILLSAGSKVTALNTTFDKNGVNVTGGSSELSVKWFMHVMVEDFFGNPISSAEIFVQDSKGALVKNGFAGVDGSIRWIVGTEYIENETMRTYYTPHIVTATVATDIVSENITLDTSKFVLLQLSTLQPAVSVNLVAGLQYSNRNADYDILASVTQNDKPRMHTPDSQISLKIYDEDMNVIVEGDLMTLLDYDLGLYSYGNKTTKGGVYFVVAHFTAQGVEGVGLTSFEVVEWIEDIINANKSLGKINEVLNHMNLTSDAINGTLNSLDKMLSDVNTSLSNQLSVMETNLLDNLASLNETNILSFLENMNSSLFAGIQDLLASITDDVIGLNASLSDQLNTLLGTLTTDNNALRNWLDIVLHQIDSNLTNAESLLANKMDEMNASMTNFNDNLVSDLAGILSSLQMHDNISYDNHSVIIGKLNDLLSGGMGEVDLSELKSMLLNLASNLSSANETIASGLFEVADDITTFQNQINQDLDEIDSTLEDLDELQTILSKLNGLDSNLTMGNNQLEEKIDEIPKDKTEEEEGFGVAEGLLIVVIVLLIINLLLSLMGRKGKSEDATSREHASRVLEDEREPEETEFEEAESEDENEI